MNLGLSTSLFCDAPLTESLPLIAKGGFKAVEIWASPDSSCRYTHFDFQNTSEVQQIKRQLSSLGLKAVSLHSPFYPSFDLSHPDRQIREASINITLSAAAALKELEGHILVVHPSGIECDRVLDLEERKERLNQIEKSIGLIYQHTANLGLVLALETLLPSFLGSDLAFLYQLVFQYPPSVGICFDTGHVYLRYMDNFINQYRQIARKVVALHVQDTLGEHDDHLPPGKGVICWKDFVKALKESNFQSTFLLEISSQRIRGNDPCLFLRNLYDHCLEILSST
ncbi:sugar phosphate isomerase/epimerase [Candidatus Methylacidiphilum infernorum]|uniref:Sugar phosphate isomerase/epimerase n=1 Tax=Candidatus Methylacidiphilum infernorum TaxID=511746 RepID=A0ABX7PVQ6_9BACT|nr:sugar phosphate isomerase/epimerase family protein [Candidatus Methylacidiphilum infernorum]QSR86679.1 sugar phosphate isomerase/epimerase [Candidatus Methylacidiphilum infernorum]